MASAHTPINQLTAISAVAILVLSSVLAGGVAAHALGARQYGSEPPANWATGRLCAGSDQCLVGDVNADGKDDVMVLSPSGEVFVALSNGSAFEVVTQWGTAQCAGGCVYKAGDVNADGKSDVVLFEHGPDTDSGHVYVALSTGSAFSSPTVWQSLFCIQGQVCEVGNFDGLSGDDIALFRPDDSGSLMGDVVVARSNGFNGFGTAEKWQDLFCLGQEDCRAGDLNGDGRTDVLAFARTGSTAGRVPVALSNGVSFNGASDWAAGFCMGDDVCAVGDFDGDRARDVLKFVRTPAAGTTYGEVYVSLSNKSNGFGDLQRWMTSFCEATDDCAVGDFNGDGRDDIIRFVKQSADPALVGAAYVALTGGTVSGFIIQPAWLQGFCMGSSTAGNSSCSTGDFNGDGLTDVVYFVRDSQSGAGRGDVFVSLNIDGTHFGPPTLWQDFTCTGGDICRAGDVNGDSMDDLIIFSRVQNGVVYVAKSTGSAFLPGEVWNQGFCMGSEVCRVSDFNGDGFADIALFTRSTYGANDRAGDVEVALNTGTQFVSTGLWHTFFCLGSEDCQTGDVNGDGQDDIVAFARGSAPEVYVELSTGIQFGDGVAPVETWQYTFCAGNETCATGDFNGDGRADIAAFTQGNSAGTGAYGDVYVGLSQGSANAGGFVSQKWQDYFCVGGEVCGTGYFNRDNREDVVTFSRQTMGSVFVGLSSGGTGYYFGPSPTPTETVTPTVTATPTATPTLTPTPSATATVRTAGQLYLPLLLWQ